MPSKPPSTRNAWAIQRFQASDAAAVQEIALQAEEASQWSRKSYADLAACGSGLVLTCVRGGELLGFVAARQTAGQAEVLNIAVRKRARRQGIASALLDTLFAGFRRASVRDVFLEVRESNGAAIALYRKFGFAVSGRRKQYYQNPAEDAVCLSAKLTAPPD